MLRFELNKGKSRIDLGGELKKLEKIALIKFHLSGVISLVFVDAKTIKKLNKTYRQKNKSTDILTFVYGDNGLLGEIILSLADVKKRAKKECRSLKETVIYLIIHGLLHIFGFDHKKAKEARRMEKKEKEILKVLNL